MPPAGRRDLASWRGGDRPGGKFFRFLRPPPVAASVLALSLRSAPWLLSHLAREAAQVASPCFLLTDACCFQIDPKQSSVDSFLTFPLFSVPAVALVGRSGCGVGCLAFVSLASLRRVRGPGVLCTRGGAGLGGSCSGRVQCSFSVRGGRAGLLRGESCGGPRRQRPAGCPPFGVWGGVFPGGGSRPGLLGLPVALPCGWSGGARSSLCAKWRNPGPVVTGSVQPSPIPLGDHPSYRLFLFSTSMPSGLEVPCSFGEEVLFYRLSPASVSTLRNSSRVSQFAVSWSRFMPLRVSSLLWSSDVLLLTFLALIQIRLLLGFSSSFNRL